jgi:hypothetical protein
MHSNVLAAEKVAIAAALVPATVSNTEVFSGVVDMSTFGQVLGVAQLGNMAAETIDFKAYTCAADGGSATLLKSCTQLAAHASNNDGKQLAINVRGGELLASSARYVKFGLVTGGSTGGPAAILVLGTDMRIGGAAENDASSVVQIKT